MTVRNPICFRGIGLHSGEPSELHIIPGYLNQGIVFHVMDEWECVALIGATIENASCGNLRTVLRSNDHAIDTVEHILAALTGCGVDNAVIKIWGKEVPIMDGSTSGWVDLITESGDLKQQDGLRKLIRITKRIECESNGSWCYLEPNDGARDLSLEYEMSYDHPLIGDQKMSLVLTNDSFKNDLSRARTFGFFKDLDMIRSKGLAKGATLENTLVFDDLGIKNQDGMRWHDEPIRHKLVDAIGDLSLAGHRIAGRFVGHRSGHALNQDLIRNLMNSRSSWRFESCEITA